MSNGTCPSCPHFSEEPLGFFCTFRQLAIPSPRATCLNRLTEGPTWGPMFVRAGHSWLPCVGDQAPWRMDALGMGNRCAICRDRSNTDELLLRLGPNESLYFCTDAHYLHWWREHHSGENLPAFAGWAEELEELKDVPKEPTDRNPDILEPDHRVLGFIRASFPDLVAALPPGLRPFRHRVDRTIFLGYSTHPELVVIYWAMQTEDLPKGYASLAIRSSSGGEDIFILMRQQGRSFAFRNRYVCWLTEGDSYAETLQLFQRAKKHWERGDPSVWCCDGSWR